MSWQEIFIFSFRSAAANPMNIAFALLVAAAAYIFILSFRWLFNKKWSGGRTLMLVSGLIAGVIAFSYFGLTEAQSYIESQKARQLTKLKGEALLRHDMLSSAWDQLDEAGKQEGLTAPEDVGTEIRLHSIADAQIYAQESAGLLAEKFAEGFPGLPRTTVDFQSKEDIAIQVVEGSSEIQLKEYPWEMNQANVISDQVLGLRIEEVVGAARNGVESGSPGLEQMLRQVFFFVIFIFTALVCFWAYRDLLNAH